MSIPTPHALNNTYQIWEVPISYSGISGVAETLRRNFDFTTKGILLSRMKKRTT